MGGQTPAIGVTRGISWDSPQPNSSRTISFSQRLSLSFSLPMPFGGSGLIGRHFRGSPEHFDTHSFGITFPRCFFRACILLRGRFHRRVQAECPRCRPRCSPKGNAEGHGSEVRDEGRGLVGQLPGRGVERDPAPREEGKSAGKIADRRRMEAEREVLDRVSQSWSTVRVASRTETVWVEG